MVKCEECGKEFPSERSLHAHLKSHKLKVKDYYHKHFPRRDKNNLKKWMSHVEPSEAKEYFKNFLSGRKKKKDLEFAPCQVELRSLMSPSVSYYQKVFGDYNEICNEVGLVTKYETISEPLSYSPENYKEEKIYIDTREQNPLEIEDYPTEIKGLIWRLCS